MTLNEANRQHLLELLEKLRQQGFSSAYHDGRGNTRESDQADIAAEKLKKEILEIFACLECRIPEGW